MRILLVAASLFASVSFAYKGEVLVTQTGMRISGEIARQIFERAPVSERVDLAKIGIRMKHIEATGIDCWLQPGGNHYCNAPFSGLHLFVQPKAKFQGEAYYYGDRIYIRGAAAKAIWHTSYDGELKDDGDMKVKVVGDEFECRHTDEFDYQCELPVY